MLQDEVDGVKEGSRKVAKAAGFTYPTTAPQVNVFGPVSRENHLCYTALPSFSIPFLMDVTEGCKNLTKVSVVTLFSNNILYLLKDDRDNIPKNVLVNMQALEGYRRDSIKHIGAVYDMFANGFIK